MEFLLTTVLCFAENVYKLFCIFNKEAYKIIVSSFHFK